MTIPDDALPPEAFADEGRPPENGNGDRVPPHSVELESQVLGAMLLSQTALAKAVELLDADTFYWGRHQHIFKAIARLYEGGKPADIPLIADELEKKRVLEECGGMAYLADVAYSTGTSVNVEHHAKQILEYAARRKVIHDAHELTERAYDGVDDIYAAAEGFSHDLRHLPRVEKQTYEPVATGIDDAYDQLADHISGRRPEIVTGWWELDWRVQMWPGNMIVLGADPGGGKTVFLENIAAHVAGEGKAVGFFSLEMGREEHQKRMIKARAQVATPFGQPRTTDEWTRLGKAADHVRDLPIFFDDTGGITIDQIVSQSRQMVDDHNVRVIIVDYLQLMNSSAKAETRALEVGRMARGLKNMARDLRVIVIAASQLNREGAKLNRKPMMFDLRESGDIEQAADVIWLMWAKDGLSAMARTFIIAKQRNGALWDIPALFHRNFHQIDIPGRDEPPAREPDEAPEDDGAFDRATEAPVPWSESAERKRDEQMELLQHDQRE